MIFLPAGVKVHLALGHTDMRKGLDGLATLIQEHLKKDPFSGHLFVFRGKNASLLKILFWDGTGLCLFTKRMDHGSFWWPRVAEPGGSVTLARAGTLLASASRRLNRKTCILLRVVARPAEKLGRTHCIRAWCTNNSKKRVQAFATRESHCELFKKARSNRCMQQQSPAFWMFSQLRRCRARSRSKRAPMPH